ncbi:MAG: phosphoribosylformylglycinamidine synthase I [Chloroflexota bacterium]
MGKPKALILRGPGTNCDRETAFAFEQAGAATALVHINRLISGEERLGDYQIMVIPGGFTYGDDIAAGKVLANELMLRVGEQVRRFVSEGRLVLGICNGFQVMVKAGILPGPGGSDVPRITLTSNDSNRFECRWVHLGVEQASPCVFTRGIQRMYLPVAHAEGKLVASPEALPELFVVLRYTSPDGKSGAGYPHNPNGSVADIAGICDASGRVFALMPHPERYLRRTQHPRWTRGEGGEPGDGFKIFANAVAFFKGG